MTDFVEGLVFFDKIVHYVHTRLAAAVIVRLSPQPPEWAEKMLGESQEYFGPIAEALTHPVDAVKAMAQETSDTYETEGLVYTGAYVIADIMIGKAVTAGISKAAGKGAGAVDEIGDIAGKADDVADVAETAGKMDDVVDAARTTEKTGDVTEVAAKGDKASSFRDLMSPAERARYDQYWNDKITSIPKGSRPDPSKYLSKEYIDTHLSQFENGISIIMTEQNYEKFVLGNDFIGIPSDGTQFVLPKNLCDDIAAQANGSVNFYEKALGFDEGHFKKGGGLIRIDVDDISDLNLRIPSGNEYGANDHWIPGGYTDGGVAEAISDLIPNKPDKIKITEIKK